MIFSVSVYLVFICALIGTYIFSLIFFKNKEERHKIFFCSIVSCGLLWLLFTFKGVGTGSDTNSYYTLYDFISKDTLFLNETLKNPIHYEVGFLFLMSLIAHTHVPYIVFQAFVYLIICGCLFYTVLKLSKNPAFSILIFFTFTFYNFFISGLRQSLAISLCIFALAFTISSKKDVFKYFLYFLIIGLACSIHNSAFLFLPVVFLRKVKIGQRGLVALMFVTILFYIFGYQLFNLIISLASLTNLVYVEGYVAYAGGIGKTPILMLLLTIISFMFLCPNVFSEKIFPSLCDRFKLKSSFFQLKENYDPNADYQGVLIVMMFFGCCLEFLNRFSSGIGRGSMYFTIAIIVLLPNAIERIANKRVKYIVEALACVGFIGFLFYYSILTDLMNFRYQFYF